LHVSAIRQKTLVSLSSLLLDIRPFRIDISQANLDNLKSGFHIDDKAVYAPPLTELHLGACSGLTMVLCTLSCCARMMPSFGNMRESRAVT
jgi:hypothetical protein